MPCRMPARRFLHFGVDATSTVWLLRLTEYYSVYGIMDAICCCQLPEPPVLCSACWRSAPCSVAVRLLARRPSLLLIHGASSDGGFLSCTFHTLGLVTFASLIVRNMRSPDGIVWCTSPFWCLDMILASPPDPSNVLLCIFQLTIFNIHAFLLFRAATSRIWTTSRLPALGGSAADYIVAVICVRCCSSCHEDTRSVNFMCARCSRWRRRSSSVSAARFRGLCEDDDSTGSRSSLLFDSVGNAASD